MKKNNIMNSFFAPVSTNKHGDAISLKSTTKSKKPYPETPLPKKPIDINFSTILQRDSIRVEITKILNDFESHRNTITFKKGIYIYGSPGAGKTHFIVDLLKSLNYDVIKYDAGDVRNRSLIDSITSNNISNRNVLHMMNKTEKKIAIVMDEIDGMNNGDKGGINALIKMIRQKKTKKQRLENVTLNPIICIGNYYMDKKIKELIKVCNVFELKAPTLSQMSNLLDLTVLSNSASSLETLRPQLLEYIQSDLRKLVFIRNLHAKKPEILTEETLQHILQMKSYNEDSKKITQLLLTEKKSIEQHSTFINETDRTIVALLWHENIADCLSKYSPSIYMPFYLKILDNICYADYIDRITFQNQIWVFNEMSSLIKTFYNHKIYHDTFQASSKIEEIRFTKVLTKYSTEYNNILFIYNLCQNLDMDKKDVVAFFQELRMHFGGNENMDFIQNSTRNAENENLNEIEEFFENYDITKLDIRRMYRYLDKNAKKEAVVIYDSDDDDE
jgi:hypothetical protein